MQVFFNFLQSLNTILIIIIIFLLIIAFIALSQMNQRQKRMARRYNKLLRGRGELNIEELIGAHSRDIDYQANKLIELSEEIDNREKNLQRGLRDLNQRTKDSIQNIGFHSYNAFDYSSNELSFSLALLDEENTGIIVTSIYGRESSVTYAKEVIQGQVQKDLSIEEELALARALENK